MNVFVCQDILTSSHLHGMPLPTQRHQSWHFHFRRANSFSRIDNWIRWWTKTCSKLGAHWKDIPQSHTDLGESEQSVCVWRQVTYLCSTYEHYGMNRAQIILFDFTERKRKNYYLLDDTRNRKHRAVAQCRWWLTTTTTVCSGMEWIHCADWER